MPEQSRSLEAAQKRSYTLGILSLNDISRISIKIVKYPSMGRNRHDLVDLLSLSMRAPSSQQRSEPFKLGWRKKTPHLRLKGQLLVGEVLIA
jgi:hypothetical protein